MRRPPAGPLSRLRLADLLPVATIGLRTRPGRAALSVLGVAIGIAAMVAVLGVTRSSQAEVLAQLDRLGTNLLTVASSDPRGGQETQLPDGAASSVRRTEGVLAASATAQLDDLAVYRSDLIPDAHGGGLDVRATDTALLSTLDASLLNGVFLDEATANYPVVVLGFKAATVLGVADLTGDDRIWLGDRWFVVVGILQPVELAPEIDRAALIGFGAAASGLGWDGHPTRVYVRTDTTRTEEVASMLPRAANPQAASRVAVSRPSDVLSARLTVADATTSLFLGLGAVALLVGGIGIANVMVISVLERRGEVGLRRALGAARRHVAVQFVVESVLLGAVGGGVGVLLGAAVTVVLAQNRGWQPIIPPAAAGLGLAAAVVVGTVAGLYPALRAARMPPTEALRTA
ncbi:ABC transporter permease [Actinoplanes xinjiangensis]|uniref:Putative ABC transport system permease protein n=1 Tax=Actinoplanes xinjiangensis TaxID=512350 RepID=A0A316FYD2_9ACTN|nr:ABC transporter permease [Actinoplanes xinjiangensis]PWK52550.1 putative ABC transport system permease protein [Actinoplanes xinjiangensis]GIF36752.1 ABC transporter permease [Actinoplanes xinjiangensis]